MDRIANMLSHMKNSAMAGNPFVEVIYSKECEAIAKVLKDRGFLSQVKIFKPKDTQYKMLNLALAYENKLPLLTEAKRISKPGRRIYKSYSQLSKVKAGFGVAVISTSRGIMSSEEAKKKKLGGEFICQVS